MGTTKLTRKEILAEDQVHGSIITLIDFISSHKKSLSIIVLAAIVLALGVYGGILFLEKKDIQAQEILGKGMDCYHAKVDSESTDDPYEKGPPYVFGSDSQKYQAAAKEFSSIVSGFGYSKVSRIARYYLGLTQLKLGENEEAVRNLEMVANNSKGRTVGSLAKKVLARNYESSGNYGEAKNILESMIADEQYDLPKEDLSLDLSRILIAEGNREEAVKVLQEAIAQGSTYSAFNQKLTSELEKIQNKTQTQTEP